jgi:AcrR family transcriptional regulator
MTTAKRRNRKPAKPGRATGAEQAAKPTPDEPSVRQQLIAAAETCLREVGHSHLSTRRVADAAGVPLSQIHYHFGSKQKLVLAVLEAQNERLLDRQTHLYAGEAPLWRQWQQACDYLEDDLESGYVRVLQEMIATGWAEPEVAEAVHRQLSGWMDLLTGVAQRAEERTGGYGPFSAREVAALVGAVFLGFEAMILLGVDEEELPARAALRHVGELIRVFETGTGSEEA